MVGCTRRPRKRAKVPFAEPPWNERSDEWQTRDQQVSADHPAREVVEAMRQLDLTPLFDLYLGVGLPPIRPVKDVCNNEGFALGCPITAFQA